MALSKSEQALLHSIDNRLAVLTERDEKMRESVDRLKIKQELMETTIYKNGLSSQVKALYDWMVSEKEEKKIMQADTLQLNIQEDKQEHEIKMLGVTVSATMRERIFTGIIAGSFTVIGIILSK